MSAPAATAGFRALEAERIALIHGPFFTDDFDRKGAAYFQERGFEVVHVSHLLPPVEVPHPNTGSVASPAEIYEWVRSHVPSSAQAVFIGGNAVRAIGVIAALEEDLRRPVLTANQVSLWHALRVAGAEVSVDDYGQLLKLARSRRPDGAAHPSSWPDSVRHRASRAAPGARESRSRSLDRAGFGPRAGTVPNMLRGIRCP